jgi:hypothetical protein
VGVRGVDESGGSEGGQVYTGETVVVLGAGDRAVVRWRKKLKHFFVS